MGEEVEKMITAGHEPLVFCSPQVRTQVRRLAGQVQGDIVVLSYNEVLPETRVEALGVVGLEEPQPAAPAAV